MSVELDTAARQFDAKFGGKPEVAVRAPGRVNLVGEHTDYNHGFVLPMAIDRDTVIVARRRPDRTVRVYAANFDQTAEFELGQWERSADCPWLDYVAGVAREVEKLGKPLFGADCLLLGDVPIGAGLSSSASVEMAALALFEAMGDFVLSDPDAAALGQRVENDFLGVASGIMDQFIVRAGKAGHALFFDCRTMAFSHVPVAMDDAAFVITDTRVSRGLAGSAYNERVRECAEAVAAANAATGRSATHLRDFSIDDLESVRDRMPDAIYRRARHVITENGRTHEACAALRAQNAARLGELFDASDRSLREDYEVTCPELDAMTSLGRAYPGCFGSRMTGAGFGGCAVHLVSAKSAPEFCSYIRTAYSSTTGIESTAILVSASQGASASAT